MWKPDWKVFVSAALALYAIAAVSQLVPAASPAAVAGKLPQLTK